MNKQQNGTELSSGVVRDLAAEKKLLREFHAEIFAQYREIFGEDRNAVFHMKELWSYMLQNFEHSEKIGKKDPQSFQSNGIPLRGGPPVPRVRPACGWIGGAGADDVLMELLNQVRALPAPTVFALWWRIAKRVFCCHIFHVFTKRLYIV